VRLNAGLHFVKLRMRPLHACPVVAMAKAGVLGHAAAAGYDKRMLGVDVGELQSERAPGEQQHEPPGIGAGGRSAAFVDAEQLQLVPAGGQRLQGRCGALVFLARNFSRV
jgi:hypothetical protein